MEISKKGVVMRGISEWPRLVVVCRAKSPCPFCFGVRQGQTYIRHYRKAPAKAIAAAPERPASENAVSGIRELISRCIAMNWERAQGSAAEMLEALAPIPTLSESTQLSLNYANPVPAGSRSKDRSPDRLARAGRPPGHEFIARERLVDGFARGLDAGHRQTRRIE